MKLVIQLVMQPVPTGAEVDATGLMLGVELGPFEIASLGAFVYSFPQIE